MKLAQQFYMEREIAALQEKLATEKEKVATRENALRVLNEAVMKLAKQLEVFPQHFFVLLWVRNPKQRCLICIAS